MQSDTLELRRYSEMHYEPAALVPCIWHTAHSRIRVFVLAYSLGATIAFCLRPSTDGLLISGNYECFWIPTAQLEQVIE